MALKLDDYTGTNDEKVASLLADGVAQGYEITPFIANKIRYYALLKGTREDHESCEVKLDGEWLADFPRTTMN